MLKQELTTSKEIVETKKDRREGKGRCIALSRRIYRLLQTEDVFYVESESTDGIYYLKYELNVLEWCSCMDNSTRHKKCKHIFGIEFAIRMGTLKDTDKLPADAKRDITITAVTSAQDNKSFEEDDYSF